MSRIKLLLDVVNDMQSLAESLKVLAKAISSNDTVAVSSNKTAAETTIEDVRSVLVSLSQDGKTAEVKALLKKYGANKLSEIEPDSYQALLLDAKELTNG